MKQQFIVNLLASKTILNLQSRHHGFGNPLHSHQVAFGPEKENIKGSPSGVRKLAGFLAKPLSRPYSFLSHEQAKQNKRKQSRNNHSQWFFPYIFFKLKYIFKTQQNIRKNSDKNQRINPHSIYHFHSKQRQKKQISASSTSRHFMHMKHN